MKHKAVARAHKTMRIASGVESLGFSGGSVIKNLPARQETQEMVIYPWVRKIPGSERSPGEGKGNPL